MPGTSDIKKSIQSTNELRCRGQVPLLGFQSSRGLDVRAGFKIAGVETRRFLRIYLARALGIDHADRNSIFVHIRDQGNMTDFPGIHGAQKKNPCLAFADALGLHSGSTLCVGLPSHPDCRFRRRHWPSRDYGKAAPVRQRSWAAFPLLTLWTTASKGTTIAADPPRGAFADFVNDVLMPVLEACDAETPLTGIISEVLYGKKEPNKKTGTRHFTEK